MLCSQTRTVTADCLKLLTYTVNGSCIFIILDTNSRTFQDDLIIETLHNWVIPGDLHYFLKYARATERKVCRNQVSNCSRSLWKFLVCTVKKVKILQHRKTQKVRENFRKIGKKEKEISEIESCHRKWDSKSVQSHHEALRLPKDLWVLGTRILKKPKEPWRRVLNFQYYPFSQRKFSWWCWWLMTANKA